jgi:ABC-type glycerol-3-phosphate transport system substrate-binding protein
MRKILLGMSLTVALLAGCSSSSSSDTTVAIETTDTATATGDVVEIALIVGENTGADVKQTVPLGSSVRITVTNPNGPDEIHVHGYDISTGEMAKGQEAVIEFVASNAGTFDLESHVSEEVVLILTVE